MNQLAASLTGLGGTLYKWFPVDQLIPRRISSIPQAIVTGIAPALMVNQKLRGQAPYSFGTSLAYSLVSSIGGKALQYLEYSWIQGRFSNSPVDLMLPPRGGTRTDTYGQRLYTNVYQTTVLSGGSTKTLLGPMAGQASGQLSAASQGLKSLQDQWTISQAGLSDKHLEIFENWGLAEEKVKDLLLQKGLAETEQKSTLALLQATEAERDMLGVLKAGKAEIARNIKPAVKFVDGDVSTAGGFGGKTALELTQNKAKVLAVEDIVSDASSHVSEMGDEAAEALVQALNYPEQQKAAWHTFIKARIEDLPVGTEGFAGLADLSADGAFEEAYIFYEKHLTDKIREAGVKIHELQATATAHTTALARCKAEIVGYQAQIAQVKQLKKFSLAEADDVAVNAKLDRLRKALVNQHKAKVIAFADSAPAPAATSNIQRTVLNSAFKVMDFVLTLYQISCVMNDQKAHNEKVTQLYKAHTPGKSSSSSSIWWPFS